MNLNVFEWRSLKTRVTFFTLMIFLASIWSLAFYTSRMLREDMQNLLGEQQFSTASYIAASINDGVETRFKALETVASKIAPALLSNTSALQSALEQNAVLENLFNAGIFVTRIDGIAAASMPRALGRTGVDYLDRDYIATALKEGRAIVGRPVMGRKVSAPIFGMAFPIRDSRGKVIGALAGVTDLSRNNFLDRIAGGNYGRTGAYLLAAPQHNVFVTASDKSRAMRPLPPPGSNPLHDRYAKGYEGHGVLTNFRGEEELTAAKGIPLAGWFLGVALPTREAFAPIRVMQQRMLLAAVVLTLLAGVLTWWLLKRQLSPMLAAVTRLAKLADSDQPLQALPVTRLDEIGQLIQGFNRLLEKLAKRDEALRESEARFRTLTEMSSDFYWESDVAHKVTERISSKQVAEDAALRRGLFVGKRRWEVPCLTPDEAGWDAHRALLDAHKSFRQFEISRHGVNGDVCHVAISGDPIFDAAGNFKGYRGIGTDITAQKKTEAELRIAASAFEAQESMIITDEKRVILRVNKAFIRNTGYTAEEVVGQTPDRFNSSHHDENFYHAMWESINGTGRWQGEIWGRRKDGEVYPAWLSISAVKNAAGNVTHYIGAQLDITERKEAEEKINELAYYDQLTGLPNRILLLDRLRLCMAASSRNGTYGALLFIDLDQFKVINDTLGHEIGDLLLKQVADRLSECVRAEDTVARFGGDEFMVMLAGLSLNEEEAADSTEAVAEKILAALNQTYRLGHVEHHSTSSIGVTIFKDHRVPVEELMKQADLAMYRAKDAGRNAICFFDPAMETAVVERAALEEDLRRAIEDKQFVLHYQAQVAGAGRVTGAEVLVRWQHPQRGMVSPAEFIPMAEETGLILSLGHWVLQTACEQLAAWSGRADLAHLSIAVNVSARQFHQPEFVDQVLAVIKRTGANPQRLKLELTESLLVANVDEMIEKMFMLKARGVGFSLDDFGTGFSSLTYLKRLPLDQLKIDQSFVRDVLIDPNDAAIAKTIVALAQSLGIGVMAEGVETQAQRDFLFGAGCHAYQGYFFSRPLPLEDFEALAQQAAGLPGAAGVA